MQSKKRQIRVQWRSLSLRLSAFFVVVLVAAALAIGYLFDRGRTEATRELGLARLRLHAERGADELEHSVRQLGRDVLFLAGTPPVQGIGRALNGGGFDPIGRSDARQWKEQLQQIFLAFAKARLQYFQLRLIGVADKGRELVRVERAANGQAHAVTEDALQAKGQRDYFHEAARLEPGQVYLSRIDLNREHGRISVPHQPTLRAVTPVRDPSGNLFGLVVVNMDMAAVFARVLAFTDPAESLYLANEQGDFLLHPEPGRAFAFELGTAYRLADAFPGTQERLSNASTGSSSYVQFPGSDGEVIAYVTERSWDPRDSARRLIFILTELADRATGLDGTWSRERLLAAPALLLLAMGLVVLGVRRLTRSLRAIAGASQAIAKGNYRAVLPAGGGSEVSGLVRAFRHMAKEIETREAELGALNQGLEQRVKERTAELTQAHSWQETILDNIADGVVATDREGRFLLWNAKAEQIIGAGPDQVAPERWSSHYGLFWEEAGAPIPTADLPLVHAMQGQSSESVEMYVHNPHCEAGRWIQVTARPLLGPQGEINGGVAMMVDVTEQKRLRKRVESERAQLVELAPLALGAAIASSTVHRLSQPLAAMNNYAGAAVRLHAQQRLTEAELRDLLARIETCAARASEGLNELRTLIRHRNNPAVPVDVNQMVDSSLQFLHHHIERLGVTVDRRYGTKLPQPMGDPIELSHVTIQLISSSLESLAGIEPAQRRLLAGTRHDPQAGVVLIEVADSWRSLDPELERQLFDPLPAEMPVATGFGLYIAKTIVDNHKGEISIEPGEAGGVMFVIKLPIAREGAG